MKILFISKKTKWCQKAKKYVLQKFENVEVIQGENGENFPHKINNWKGDLILSYLSPWIIPEKNLKNSKTSINFHPGPPKYGGTGCYNFAIYNEEKRYGVLCHHMEKKVDSGEIIRIKEFPTSKDETIISLKEKSMKNLIKLFYDIIDLIKDGKELPTSKRKWKKRPYTRKDLQEICEINLDMSQKEILKRIRATYYPKGPDFPHIVINDKKLVLKEIEINELENTSL
jgi:methionyl-tRNA formyltransferase